MIDEQFILALQGNFDRLLPTINPTPAQAVANILKDIPNAENISQILALYYLADKTRKDIQNKIEVTFLRTLSKAQIILIYNNALSEALQQMLQSNNNILVSEYAALQSQFSFAKKTLLTNMLRVFSTQLKRASCLRIIHDKMIAAVLNQLVCSTLFGTCDANLPAIFKTSLEVQLEKIENILNERIIQDRSFEENFFLIYQPSIKDDIRTIYNSIRSETEVARAIMPALPKDNQTYVICPERIRDELINNFIFYLNNRNIKSQFKEHFNSAFIARFTAQFNCGFYNHARAVASSHKTMAAQQRAYLCKLNYWLEDFYMTNLDVSSVSLAWFKFVEFIRNYENGIFMPFAYLIIQPALDIAKFFLQEDMVDGKGLSEAFKWPSMRAQNSIESTIPAPNLSL